MTYQKFVKLGFPKKCTKDLVDFQSMPFLSGRHGAKNRSKGTLSLGPKFISFPFFSLLFLAFFCYDGQHFFVYFSFGQALKKKIQGQ